MALLDAHSLSAVADQFVLSDLHRVDKQLSWHVVHQSVYPAMSYRLNVITELLCVKFNFMQLSLLNSDEVDFMLNYLCTT